MTPELQRYYEDQFSMMSTKGWTDLMEDLQELNNQLDHVSGITPDELKFRQGQLDILGLILGRRAMCDKTYEELANETTI